MRKPIVSGIHCPFRCKKFGLRQERLNKLFEEFEELAAEKKALLDEIDRLNNRIKAINYIPLIAGGGHQILSIEEREQEILASFFLKANPSSFLRTVYLMRLPLPDQEIITTGPSRICCMYLKIFANGTAHIDDWRSYEQRKGYGTVLMNHVIRYLQSANIRLLDGAISKVDFDRREDLVRFYSRFGFEITEREHEWRLKLDLWEAKFAEYLPKHMEMPEGQSWY